MAFITPAAQKVKPALFLVLVGLLTLPLFIHLDQLPIRLWDESRLAVNAQEMYKNGNYVVTHFNGEPDMWNTKPPMMIWMQVGFMKVLGVNEWAVRLPAALAAFATCLLMIYFSYKAFGSYLLGILAAFVLVTSNGYVHEHISRSGDYDALLTLFTTAYCLSFFLYLQKENSRYLHLFFVALTLTVLTKSIQGLIFLPILLLLVLQQKKLMLVLKNRWLYINTILFLLIAGGYYLLREAYNPGYLQAVWENDLGGRYVNDLVEGKRDSWYYLKNLVTTEFTYWLLFAIAGYGVALFSGPKAVRAFGLYVLSLTAFYLLILSTAQTKLPWYAAPLFPLLSLSAAIALQWMLINSAAKLDSRSRFKLLPYIIIALLFVYPYQHIFRKSFRPVEEEWDKDLYPISNVLMEADRGLSSLHNHFVCYEEYSAQLLFYINSLNDKKQAISYKTIEQIEAGDYVIASEPHIKALIEEKFNHQLVRQYYNVDIYAIKSQKAENGLSIKHRPSADPIPFQILN